MKTYLMYPDRDFDPQRDLPCNAEALTRDLDLDTLFDAIAAGDGFLRDVAQHAILSSLDDLAVIRYRQDVLRDCLDQPDVVRELYAIAVDAVAGERKVYRGILGLYPDSILSRAVEVLHMLHGMLRRLRQVADRCATTLRSEGFTRFFTMIARELDDEYLQAITDHLNRLRFRGGVLVSAGLGPGNKGTNYLLRTPAGRRRGLRERIGMAERTSYSFQIADRDEAGAQALSELRGRGINLAANALSQSTDHIVAFFAVLRAELGFYLGCLNLHERLTGNGEPTCFPEPEATATLGLSFRGLYDPCLSLHLHERAVGNDLDADQVNLVMVTGANQGGKSTFLRSAGVAQLMMQAGMFVPAHMFRSSVCAGLFTHFKREEDQAMESGKLDEELRRMSQIADHLTPTSMVLCNESFAATNEREGSEIARQIIRALRENDVRVLYVTHLYDLANSLQRRKERNAVFLRAGRRRTFRLVEGAPQPTSYGEDLYQRTFDT